MERTILEHIGEIPDGLVWKYEMNVRGGSPEHVWALVGDAGAIHIHGWLSEFRGEYRWSGGIEVHSATPFEYSGEEPDHEHCWLLGKPCWHDGTSLGFSERVADRLPDPCRPDTAHEMQPDHHAFVTDVLRQWFRENFPARGMEARQGGHAAGGAVHDSPVPTERAP